jgi:hypothetical protein
MAKLLSPTSKNFVQKTLDAQLLSGATASVTLNNVDGIPNLPGVFIIDRVDSNGGLTTSKREVIEYTAVSGNTLTGLIRNADSSGSDQDHEVGAIVEFSADALWGGRVYTALAGLVDANDISQINSSLVTLTGTQTLTNKTLTTPDLNGSELILDADADTSVTADTDDQIDFKTSGADAFRMKATDFDLVGAAANITVAGADPKRTLYVPASAMYPSTTAACASLAQVETSTNKVNVKVLDFDGAGSSKEYAEFGVQSPTYWDASTVTAQFIWLASAGSGTVNWEIQGGAFSDDDALDAAYGTLQEVTDTVTAIGDVHISAETSAITVAGTPVAGDWLQFRIARDPANDTDTSDARLMGVRIRFGITQYNDN